MESKGSVKHVSLPDFDPAPGEVFMQCPYQPSHLVLTNRFTKHIGNCMIAYMKQCEQQGKSVKLVTCKYNANHRMLKEKLAAHETECELGKTTANNEIANNEFTEFIQKLKASNINDASHVKVKEKSSPGNEDEEDWEKECTGSTPAYDPSIRLSRGPPVPLVRQGTPSEKKAFRQAQKLRAEECKRQKN